ncbi:GNAT family protein [Paenibacillus aurantius]|uniref:GNAT family protein n=1 Tax=Paenibacillus aurantius TaxID=2918900 RepID=A0AA96RBU0_9BACL|nr:GNAT family protein [Paenibacillus aurantius]WNQ09775.1 GNAT family protein [Paenibacillus aurantius]
MDTNSPVYIRRYEPSDAPAQLELRLRNRTFMAPYDPVRPASFYTLEGQREQLERSLAGWEKDEEYAFAVCLVEGGELIGRVALSSVVRGAWQNANLGYFIDSAHNGKGFATEAVRQAVAFAFGEAGLHRVQAAIMPWNRPSIRVVEKAGFRLEGLAVKYLRIHGQWEDHRIYAVTNDSIE